MGGSTTSLNCNCNLAPWGLLTSVKVRGDALLPVPAPLPKHSSCLVLVEQLVFELHLSLEGALCDRTVGPTGSAAPEPGFSSIHEELLVLNID